MQQWKRWCWTNYHWIQSSFSLHCRSCYCFDLRLPFWARVKEQICLWHKHTGWDTGSPALQKRGNGMFIQLDWEIWILHVYHLRASGSATAFKLWEVKGQGGIIWIRTCSEKKNSKKRYPDVSARDFVFFYIMSVLFPFSLCFLSEVTTTAHNMQTNTGSYSKSREGALHLRRAVRVNLKP